MGIKIPLYEGRRGDEDSPGGYSLPTKDEFDALVDRVNAIAAQVGGAVGALAALPHSDPSSGGGVGGQF